MSIKNLQRSVKLTLAALLVLCTVVNADELLLYEDEWPVAPVDVVPLRGADYTVCLGESNPDAVVLDEDAATRQYLRVMLSNEAAEDKLTELGEVVLNRDGLCLVRWNGVIPDSFTLEGIHGVPPLEPRATPSSTPVQTLPPLPDDDLLAEIVAVVDEAQIKSYIQEM